jgi:hypothetical protein
MKRSFGRNLTNVVQNSIISQNKQNDTFRSHALVKPKPVFAYTNVQNNCPTPTVTHYESLPPLTHLETVSINHQEIQTVPMTHHMTHSSQTFQNIEYIETTPTARIKPNCQVTPLVRLRQLPNILKRSRRSSSSSSSSHVTSGSKNIGIYVPTTPTEVSLNMTPIIDANNQRKSIKIERHDSTGLNPITPKNRKNQKNKENPFEKPPYSYMAMIQFAIESAGDERKMTLKDIYDYIENKFPYFRHAKPGWKNSVRHNLSLHPCFVRESPAPNSKTSYWCIKQTSSNPITLLHDYDEFGRKPEKRRRKEKHRPDCSKLDDNNKVVDLY